LFQHHDLFNERKKLFNTMKTLILTLIFAATLHSTRAAVTVLDSFTEGPFAISISGLTSSSASITSPFAETRGVGVISRQAMAGGTVTSTLDDSLGTLSFNVDALPSGPGAIDLRFGYSGGGPYSLLGFSALEFDFSAVAGTGSLLVALDYTEAVFGPTLFRMPVNSAGTTVFDVSGITLGSGASLADFDSMQIVIEANTEQFALTLNEIRAVPEPTILTLTLPFLLTALLRRRRN
jgi:hypothetical protein